MRDVVEWVLQAGRLLAIGPTYVVGCDSSVYGRSLRCFVVYVAVVHHVVIERWEQICLGLW